MKEEKIFRILGHDKIKSYLDCHGISPRDGAVSCGCNWLEFKSNRLPPVENHVLKRMCANCVFFKEVILDGCEGECRYSPPQSYEYTEYSISPRGKCAAEKQQDAIRGKGAMWLQVGCDYSCSGFEPKEIEVHHG